MIVVIVIVMALLIKSCDNSATNSALKTYNASVYNLIGASNSNGAKVLGPEGLESGNLSSLDLATEVQTADSQLRQAEDLSTPSQMAAAQSALVDVMKLRADAIKTIAANAAQAGNKNTSKDAVYNISVGTSELYGSDVLYKSFVGTGIAKALNAAGIPIGAGGQPINSGQILTDLGWLQSSWIADKIGAQQSTAQANANNDQPGLHGHSLNFVTVDGTQLSSTSTNTIPASNARTWVLNVTNGGNYNEFQVGCSVTISGLSDSGTATIPETIAHQTSNCTVTLPSAPTPGTYSVTARIAKVPGETNLGNNAITYSVIFN